MRTRTIISFLYCLLTLTGLGQDSLKSFKILALPSIFYAPETNWGIGLTLLGSNVPKDSSTIPSNGQLFLDYTLENQISLKHDLSLYTDKNRCFINSSSDVSRFPEYYFGTGNENLPNSGKLINITYGDLKLEFYRKILGKLFLGSGFHHQSLFDNDLNIVHGGILIDDMGYASTGIGLTALIDKRNNMLCPSEGFFFKNAIYNYFDHTHSTKGFVLNSFDLRYYKSFKSKIILNTALYSSNGYGFIPFRMMPYLGGSRYMRGYYAGRFRDNNMTSLQLEVRKHLFWRIGIAGFCGVGQVYENVREFDLDRSHYNYGVGLRFAVAKDAPGNIRLDLGKTRDSYGAYIVFAEAF